MARQPRPPAPPAGAQPPAPAAAQPAPPPAPRRRSHAGRVTAAAIGVVATTALGVALNHSAQPPAGKACAIASIDPAQSQALRAPWVQPGANSCKAITVTGGLQLPDPKCTPGAVNPTLTLAVLKDSAYKTGDCVRDKDTSPVVKNQTYGWYGIQQPSGNIGKNQVCEKDHLISLELGGADSLANIWPQCGPNAAVLNQRYFKQKDMVENYLAAQVKSGAIDLADAQHRIATDWTQYLPQAKTWYANEGGIRNDDEG